MQQQQNNASTTATPPDRIAADITTVAAWSHEALAPLSPERLQGLLTHIGYDISLGQVSGDREGAVVRLLAFRQGLFDVARARLQSEADSRPRGGQIPAPPQLGRDLIQPITPTEGVIPTGDVPARPAEDERRFDDTELSSSSGESHDGLVGSPFLLRGMGHREADTMPLFKRMWDRSATKVASGTARQLDLRAGGTPVFERALHSKLRKRLTKLYPERVEFPPYAPALAQKWRDQVPKEKMPPFNALSRIESNLLFAMRPLVQTLESLDAVLPLGSVIPDWRRHYANFFALYCDVITQLHTGRQDLVMEAVADKSAAKELGEVRSNKDVSLLSSRHVDQIRQLSKFRAAVKSSRPAPKFSPSRGRKRTRPNFRRSADKYQGYRKRDRKDDRREYADARRPFSGRGRAKTSSRPRDTK